MGLRLALVVVLLVGCTKPRGPASDPVIDDFRTVDLACRTRFEDLLRQETAKVLRFEELATEIEESVLAPWKEMRARVEKADLGNATQARRDLHATMVRYIDERQSAWSAYAGARGLPEDSLLEKYRAQDAAAAVDALALADAFRARGLEPLHPLPPDAGVALALPAKAPAGPAYLLVDDKIVRVDAQGFRVIATDVNTMDVLPDGTLWACGSWTVVRWDGTHATTQKPPEMLETCAAAPDGTFRGIGERYFEDGPDVLVRFDGSKWDVKVTPIGDVGDQARHVVVDRDGVMYVISGSRSGGEEQVYAYVDATWKPVVLPGSLGWIGHIFRGGDGHAWIFYQVQVSGGKYERYPLQLARLTPTEAEPPVYVDDDHQVSYLLASIDAAGAATIGNLEHGVIVQGTTRLRPPRGITWPGHAYPGPFAYDAAGRIWLELDTALAVIARDGSLVEYPHGSVDALTEPIQQIAVVGAGPTLPAPGQVTARTITGIAHVDGTPLANARVQICVSPEGDPPCDAAGMSRDTTTDADGHFTFADVPRWTYRLVGLRAYTDVDGKTEQWWQAGRASCCLDSPDLGRVNFGVN